MWIFIELNLHQLTDSNPQLNINNLNSRGSTDIVDSYQRGYKGEELTACNLHIIMFTVEC